MLMSNATTTSTDLVSIEEEDPQSSAHVQSSKHTLITCNQLVHDVCAQVAAYRQLVMVLGTSADDEQHREELQTARAECMQKCEHIKNSMLPELKSETHLSDGQQCNDFTRQASQFVALLGMFITEMRRGQMLLRTFATSTDDDADAVDPSNVELADRYEGCSHWQAPSSGNMLTGELPRPAPMPHTNDPQLAALNRDVVDAEEMLEKLDNQITVPFTTKDHEGREAMREASTTARRKGCHMHWCSGFKTSYA